MGINARNARIEQVKRQKRNLLLICAMLFILFFVFVRGDLKYRQEEMAEADFESLQEITIGAVGTCTLGDSRGSKTEGSFSEKYEEVKDASYFFREVYDELSKSDIALTNLEGDLSEEKHAEIKYPIKGKGEYAEILRQGSLGVINLANSRSHDYGKEGYYDTSLLLNHAGLSTFGYDRIILKTIHGSKIGFLGIDVLNEDMEPAKLLEKNMKLAEKIGADIIIVCLNWGETADEEPNKTQKEWAHKAIDLGADLVLGFHPKHLQGMDTYKERYIIYSLGNFCYGAQEEPDYWDAAIYKIKFYTKDGKLVKAGKPEEIPCDISSQKLINNYQPKLKQ